VPPRSTPVILDTAHRSTGTVTVQPASRARLVAYWSGFRALPLWAKATCWLTFPAGPLTARALADRGLWRALWVGMAALVFVGQVVLIMSLVPSRVDDRRASTLPAPTGARGDNAGQVRPSGGGTQEDLATPDRVTRQDAEHGASTWAPQSHSSSTPIESQLNALVIADPTSESGYSRDLFGGWSDDDEDGCNTRCEVLEAERIPSIPGLERGGWISIYDGITTEDESDLEIDHVVALQEAWRSGAANWDGDQRAAFANDLSEEGALVAVSARSNSSKGAQDPAEWQPPSPASWCEFASSWVAVKLKWRLTADTDEVAALRRMLSGCSPTRGQPRP
jgi:hypothetical protein